MDRIIHRVNTVIKISATARAKEIIKHDAAELGMKEMILAGRVYEWFSRQDDTLKKGILNLLPKTYEVDVARMALERIAKDAAGGKKGK